VNLATRPTANGTAAKTHTMYCGESTLPNATNPTTLAATASRSSCGPRGLRAKANHTAASATACASDPTTATIAGTEPSRSQELPSPKL